MKCNAVNAVILVVGIWAAAQAAAVPAGTGFTYQGHLQQGGLPVNGLVHLRFSLWNAATFGVQQGVDQLLTNVMVSDGLFTVLLNGDGQFGASAFNGEVRWLQIEVCPTGDCASPTVLSPRQQLAAVPYALAVPGFDTHSLDAADGSPTDAVFVDNEGNVGLGTSSPAKKLTVDGDAEIGTGHGDYQHLRLGGGNSSGFLYGSYPHFGDGIHLGYNYYADAFGNNRVIHPDGGTSRITAGYGYVALGTQAPFSGEPLDRVYVDALGNVGLGTDAPSARLEVRGSIKLGYSGQYFAPAGEENLRIVRGVVAQNGTILAGTGFSVEIVGGNDYVTIYFDPPFAGPPAVTGTAQLTSSDSFITTVGVTASYANIRARWVVGGLFPDSGATVRPFHFMAVGPR